MFTLITVLVVLLLTGLFVVMLDHLPFGAETHSISTRDFPNIAADPHPAPRDTVGHR
jgi:hypothetical protein